MRLGKSMTPAAAVFRPAGRRLRELGPQDRRIHPRSFRDSSRGERRPGPDHCPEPGRPVSPVLKKRGAPPFLILCLLLAGLAGFASPADRLSVEKVYSPELTAGLAAPQTLWLANDFVLLFDVRTDPSRRILELFDPSTNTRRPAFAPGPFLEGLRSRLGPAAPEAESWPLDISPSGDLLLYEFGGDIYCWEAERENWRRLTDTNEEETSSALSPDGLWVAFVRGADLYAVERATGKEVRLTRGGSETLRNGPLSWVYWEEIYEHARVPYAWSPDSRSIAYLQTDEHEVSVSTFVDFRPATQAVVRQRYPKAGQVNPKVRLGVVDLASARTVWVDCGSDEYIARFMWRPGGGSLAVQTLNRQQNRLRLFFADRSTGESRRILEETQPAWINLNNALHFFEDGRRFLWMSERDGHQHLYLYDVEGKLVRQLTKGNFMVVSAGGDTCNRNKGFVGVDEKGGWVYFSSNKDALPERHLFRVRLDGSGMTRLSREPGVHTTSLSPSGRWYLDSHSSSSVPPGLTLHAVAGELQATIARPVEEVFTRYGLGAREFLTYLADDGAEATLKLMKPAGFDPARRYPTLVYVYGGPGAQETMNDWPRVLWDDLMVQEGYLAVSVEVRAGLNKSKALETSGYRRAYGPLNVADILAAVRRLKEFPFVDPDRIGLWGGSGGGCTTLFTMTHCDAFKAAIALYPVSDWHFYDTIYTERYLDTPQTNPGGYAETSSVLAAGNLKGRLLIVHGTYDDNVHPQNTEAFIHALIAADKPYEMMIYPWQKHGIRGEAEEIHLGKLMIEFWRRNL